MGPRGGWSKHLGLPSRLPGPGRFCSGPLAMLNEGMPDKLLPGKQEFQDPVFFPLGKPLVAGELLAARAVVGHLGASRSRSRGIAGFLR